MTTELSSTESKLIREARKEQSLRDFAQELGVSHNSIALWENGERAVDEDRIKAWLLDRRPWVKQLGFNLFIARHGDTLAAMSQAVQATESKAA